MTIAVDLGCKATKQTAGPNLESCHINDPQGSGEKSRTLGSLFIYKNHFLLADILCHSFINANIFAKNRIQQIMIWIIGCHS